jgi:hypothetical protein
MRCSKPLIHLFALVMALGISNSVVAAIRGQWDFQTGDLRATTGIDLAYLDGPGNETAQQTVFGTTTALGLPDIGGQPAHVLGFPSALPYMGYLMYPNMAPNGGGAFVNQYTLIFDLLFPEASGEKWRALIQIDDPTNANDADVFINPAGAIGIAGQYHGTVQLNTWHRLALVFDLAAEGGPILRKYLDGVMVGQQILGEGVDGRWALSPIGGMFGDSALLFTDNNEAGDHVQPGFVSSIQAHDAALSAGYLAALGAPGSDGIPTTVVVPVTIASRRPAPDAVNVLPDSDIEIVLELGSEEFDPGQIRLRVNEELLNPEIDTADGRVTVRVGLPGLEARSENVIGLGYVDAAQGGEVNVTWDFRMAAYEPDAELEEQLRQNLTSYWKLDDGQDDPAAITMVDAVGSNHGTVGTGTAIDWWQTGAAARFGGALQVDGENVYGLVPASESLNINTDQVTLALWVKLEQLPTELAGAFGGIYDSPQDSYVLYLDKGSRELRFKVTDVVGHAARPGIPEAELRVDEWLHLVGLYDGRAGTGYGLAQVYLNGQLIDTHVGNDGSGGTGLTGAVRPGQIAGLGRDGEQAQNYLLATIDDVAVWRRALSTDEIGYLASGQPVPVTEVGPLPIRIVNQPQSQTAIEGETVALRVMVEDGTPPFSYQWRRDGVVLPEATADVLHLTARPELAGTYTVIIEDALETVTSEPAALSIVPLPSDPGESLTYAQVAHWPFDEDFAGSRSGFDGIPYGGAVIESVGARVGAGSARLTQADQSYVQIPTQVIPDRALSYSIVGWFELTGGTDRRFLWETYPNNWAISAEIVAAGTLSFSMMQEDGHWQGQNTGILPTAGWHHVIVTYDGNPGVLTLYYDGVQAGQIILNPGKGTAATTGLNLGTYRGANGRFFEGRLDEVGVWTRGLTAGEIAYLAAGNPIPTVEFGLIEITGIQVEGETVTVTWSGDRPWYQLQRRTVLTGGDWENVGEPTTTSQASDVISGETLFYRVLGDELMPIAPTPD